MKKNQSEQNKTEKKVGIYTESKIKKAERFMSGYSRYTTLSELASIATELTGMHYSVAGCGSCLNIKLTNIIKNYISTGKIMLGLK